MEAMIRGRIGARAEDQLRIGAAAAAQNIPEEARWQEWYFKFRAYILCMGSRYPDLVTAVEDSAQGPMTMANWAPDQSQGSRQLYLTLVMLTEEAALRIVQAVHDSHGAEALRLL